MVVKQSWVRRCEHAVLRVVSLVFSLASAYAIGLFFRPLDAVDRFESTITWSVALGFGVLGYMVSRGLVHRMMNGERVRVYVPICLVVELVEIACNYSLAAAQVHGASWLAAVPESQRALLTFITYVVLSVIPLVSILLAAVDMDLERAKTGSTPRGAGTRVAPLVQGVRPVQGVRAAPVALRILNGSSVAATQKVAPLPQLSTQQQQAKRAAQWQNMQRTQGPAAQAQDGFSPVGDLLYDPAKQPAAMY